MIRDPFRVAGVILIVIAAASFAGWLTGSELLLSWRPGSFPILLANAFCLLLLGIGLYSFALKKEGIAKLMSLSVMGVLIFNLVEDRFGLSLGIEYALDHLLSDHSAASALSRHMAFNTTAAVLNAAVILLMMARRSGNTLLLSCLVGMMIGGVLQVLLALLSWIHSIYYFGNLIMSLPLLTGLGCFAVAAMIEIVKVRKDLDLSMPFFVTSAVLIGTLGLVTLQNHHALEETSSYLRQTPQVRDAVESILFDVGFADADERIFNALSDEHSATDLKVALDKIRRDTKNLASLLIGNPTQYAKVRQLTGLVKLKSDELKLLIGEQTEASGPGSQPQAAAPPLVDFPKQVRKLTSEILKEDERIMKRHLDQMEANNKSLREMFLLTTLTAGIFMMISILLVQVEKRSRLRIEESLQQRNQELIESNARAQEATLLKSQFLANMSHEIRTPMNCIMGMLGLLCDTPLKADQQELASTAHKSAETLLTILNDILDFSKIESSELVFECSPFSLNEPLDNSIRLLSVQAQDKGLKLELQWEDNLPTTLLGDMGRLQQILINLLGNAIKFTEHGEVVLRVSLIKKEEKSVILRFEVRDTGIGIPIEIQDRLFVPFSQGDGKSTRKFGGTGLGLVISKELIERMGGEIHLESLPGQGSLFWFTVQFALPEIDFQPSSAPVAKEPQIAGSAPSPSPAEAMPSIISEAPAEHPHILVVEDNLVNQNVARLMLRKGGYETALAANGLEGLEAVKSGKFDLVFMDCQMPEMDGYEATKEIRKWEAERRSGGESFDPIHIIAMTANAMAGDREECLKCGMDDYLSKPLRQNDLTSAISRARKLEG